MKPHKATVMAVMVAMLAMGIAFAQPPGPPPPHDPGAMPPGPPPPPYDPDAMPPGPPPPPSPEMAAENREMMEEIMVSRLSREMELNDEQSLIFMRRFGDLRKQQMEIRKERSEILRDLRPILKQQKDEQALMQIMERLEILKAKSAESEHAIRKSFEDIGLNIWQKAKLEVFLSDFENQVRRIAQKAQGRHPGMGPGGPQGPHEFREGGGPMGGPRPGMPGEGPHRPRKADRPDGPPRQGPPPPPSPVE